MTGDVATLAAGAPVEEPASAADNRHHNFDDEVGQLLTAALARDDARGHPRCPQCGHRRFDEDHS